jgi:hypothetical protein
MAMPTNQVKKETTTQPQTSGAGPAYCRLLPYSGVIPVKSVIVEKEMASVLNSVCRQAGTRVYQNLENREGRNSIQPQRKPITNTFSTDVFFSIKGKKKNRLASRFIQT